MDAGDYRPQSPEQADDQQRVVKPHSAVRIDVHANACSYEHAFCRKNIARYKAVTRCPPLALVLLLVAATAACLPDPQRAQTVELLDQLTAARSMLGLQPPQVDPACTMLGDVQTRLYGEPGLVDIQPAWAQLRDASDALQAVCGHDAMLDEPSTDSPTIQAGRFRWQQGIEREMVVACDDLRNAAAALERGTPC